MKYIILFVLTVTLLASCSQYTCPTNNGGREPRDKTKRMTVRQWMKQRSDGYYVVTTVYGFRKETSVVFECKPDSIELEKLKNERPI